MTASHPDKLQRDAERLAMDIVLSQEQVTDELMETAINGAIAAIAAMPGLYGTGEVDRTRLQRHIEQRIVVWSPAGSSLTDDRDHIPWLDTRRAEIDWRFWERYDAYISQRLPYAAVQETRRSTDRVLGMLESPKREGERDRRGMVVGSVQSGKTNHYTALICKAADAGYRTIIVLAGMHDSLRSQTQERIDEGFLGWDSQLALTLQAGGRTHRTGVGAGPGVKLIAAASYTSSAPKGDFKQAVARQVAPQIGQDPVVLVVKKHKTILENVIAWTTRERTTDPVTGRELVLEQPLLIIDDEADNASVNTKEIEREVDDDGQLIAESDPNAINRLIRQLLSGFQQRAYIGYTATPFANIFIFEDEEHATYGKDLFPESFIERLPPPSNYIGPARVFGLPAAESPDGQAKDPLPISRIVKDADGFIIDPKSTGSLLGPTPRSLRRAILSFVLTCAARLARGEGTAHNSMLVHVTRFVAVQRLVTERIRDELEEIVLRLRNGDGDRETTILEELHALWVSDFEPTMRALQEPDRGRLLDWEEVLTHLYSGADRIQVSSINGGSQDALTYKDHRSTGLSVIAVGGNKLSRGLTLEGLTVSYYLRTSKMYDTLLQMGRWFGYRPGYLDLCRLYTSQELVDWYRDITIANEELGREFDAMADQNLTPKDYGLRVRSHPEGLLITAPTKMRHAREMKLSFQGTCPMTTAFDRNPEQQTANAAHVERWLRMQTASGRHRGRHHSRSAHIWADVPGGEIARFLEQFQSSEAARRVNGRLLSAYIHACNKDHELEKWTVALPSREEFETGPRALTFADQNIGPLERNAREPRGDTAAAFSVSSILNPPDEGLDLGPDQLERAHRDALRRFNAGKLKSDSGRAPSGPDGIGIRHARDPRRGLLILYAIIARTGQPEDDVLDPERPLFGLAVSFPRTRVDREISYQVNNVFWQLELGAA
jgi:hypothetical protein